MAATTKISWCDATFNPWVGCSRVSPGCQNCYAENLMDKRYHKVKWGPGQPRQLTKTWKDPIKWNKQAEDEGVRKKVFCASLADWLDPEVPEHWLIDLMGLIQMCPHLDWLMLTKRPERAFEGPTKWFTGLCLPNVWFGVSVESRKYYDLRVEQIGPSPPRSIGSATNQLSGPFPICATIRPEPFFLTGWSSAAKAPRRCRPGRLKFHGQCASSICAENTQSRRS